MKLLNKIFNRSSQTQPLQESVSIDNLPDTIKSVINDRIDTRVKEEIYKQQALEKKEAMRYRVPWNWNANSDGDKKMYSSVPQTFLRSLAISYPIARACINRRIRQITQLGWDITTIDDIENEKGFETQIRTVKQILKHPMGHNSRLRELLTIIIDDILTIDATCFEIQKRRNGDFMNLVPVDPTTIVLQVTETGGTPVPPLPAYAQYIFGKEVAKFTTDEMIYDSLNTRSYTPYGLSPLESLIIQVESALRGSMYNLAYLKDGNVPEGFLNLPEGEMTKDQIEEWQLWFDSMVAGDPKFMRRLKVLPFGAEYTPAKKPEDMAFERFEMWMLQQTCAVFDVQPQDIGITYQVNKSTAESQQEISRIKGLYPLANFIKELMDGVIQDRMGFENLQFMWTDLDPTDEKGQSEIDDRDIRVGIRSIDEVRIERGLEPLGIKHFILGTSGPIMIDDVISGKYMESKEENKPEPLKDEDEDEQKELRQWRKSVYNSLEQNKPIKTAFKARYIKPDVVKTISEALVGVYSKTQARMLFDQFLNPEIKASMRLLDMASKMRVAENAEII